MGRLSLFIPALLLLSLGVRAEEKPKNLDPGKDFASAKELGMPLGADDIVKRQSWARQKKDWQPFGVPMSDDDRANYSTCLDDPGWPECSRIRKDYEAKKALADLAKKKKDKPAGPPGSKPPRKTPKSKDAGGTSGGGSEDGGEGGEEGSEEEAAGEAPPERAQVSAFKSGASQAAAGRAEKMGADFNSSLTDESAGDMTGAAGGGAAKTGSSGGGQAKTETSAGAAAPKSTGDLLLASASGFKGSFDAMGLSMGRGADGKPQVQTKTGAPASAAEIAALQERIAGEPTALMRRPDFFDVLPREEFQELKEDFKGREDLKETDFKHIEMSLSDRDFLRSASCQKMSGDCNRHMTRASYKKGEDVPPEDLKKIHVAIRPKPRQLENEDEPEPDEDSGHESASAGDDQAAPAASPKSVVKGLYKKLNGVIMGVLGIFGGDQPQAAAAVSVGGGAGPGASTGKKSRSIAFTPREPRKASAVPAKAKSESGRQPAPEKKKRRGGWGWVVAALAGGAVLLKLRRPSGPPPGDSSD